MIQGTLLGAGQELEHWQEGKGGVTLTLEVALRATDAHKCERPRLIHEFSHTRREDLNKKEYRVKIITFFFLKTRLKRTLPSP